MFSVGPSMIVDRSIGYVCIQLTPSLSALFAFRINVDIAIDESRPHMLVHAYFIHDAMQFNREHTAITFEHLHTRITCIMLLYSWADWRRLQMGGKNGRSSCLK